MFTAFDKAIVGALVMVAGFVLPHFGLSLDSTISQVVAALVSGVLIYFTPNKA